MSERPGGKGLNVARVLAALGHRTVATGFAGGGTGSGRCARCSRSPRSPTRWSRSRGTTRRTVAVVDAAGGDTTQLNEPGPTVCPAEWDTFLGTYRELLADAAAVALCGSLPPGVPVGAYARTRPRRARAGVPVLLDTSGEPLRRGLAARPDLVKPNAEELARLTGAPSRCAPPATPAAAARTRGRLAGRGRAARRHPRRRLAGRPATADRGNPTGAGDSAVAGLLSGLVGGAAAGRTG